MHVLQIHVYVYVFGMDVYDIQKYVFKYVRGCVYAHAIMDK